MQTAGNGPFMSRVPRDAWIAGWGTNVGKAALFLDAGKVTAGAIEVTGAAVAVTRFDIVGIRWET